MMARHGPVRLRRRRKAASEPARDPTCRLDGAGSGAALRPRPRSCMRVLAVVLYGPALVPGHTLSASDYLWTAAPWASQRPADVRPFGSNYELVDSAVQFQPWLQYSRERLPDAPLWNTHIAPGRPYFANAQSAVLSPFSLPAYVLPFWWSLGLIAAHEGVCRRLRHLPARSRARHALRRRSPVRAGVRVQPLLPGLDLLAADERVGAAAVAVPAHREGHPQAGGRSPSAASPPSWPCSSSAAIRSRTSTCSPPRRSSSPSGRSCCGARECWGASGVRCSPSPSG